MLAAAVNFQKKKKNGREILRENRVNLPINFSSPSLFAPLFVHPRNRALLNSPRYNNFETVFNYTLRILTYNFSNSAASFLIGGLKKNTLLNILIKKKQAVHKQKIS
jgi:hypothetical protein